MNKSGIRAMKVSVANDPTFSQPAFLKVLEIQGQPLITDVLLCDCPSALSWPFFIGGELNEPASESIGSNSMVESSAFHGKEWEWFRYRSIFGAV